MVKRAVLGVWGIVFATLCACLSDLNTEDNNASAADAAANSGGDASGDSGADANDNNGNASGEASSGNANGTSNNGTSATNGNGNGNGATTGSGNTTTGNGGGTTSTGSGGTTTGSGGGNTSTGSSTGSTTTGGEDASVPKGTPVFVAVGYTGRRVYSTDLGVNWTEVNDTFNGGSGDDTFALRAVGYGHGQFIAVGWKILTSPNGVTWTSRQTPQTQWLGGIQMSSSGRLVATGGFGYSAYSEDAINWMVGGTVGNNLASRSLSFGNGMFVTATDGGLWWSSSNGTSWTELSSGHDDRAVVFCDGTFKAYDTCNSNYVGKLRAQGEGVTIRVVAGKLERSTDGTNFSPVLSQGQSLEDVVFGYAP
jgi:hypothetical protein